MSGGDEEVETKLPFAVGAVLAGLLMASGWTARAVTPGPIERAPRFSDVHAAGPRVDSTVARMITLGRTLPTIIASAREGLKDFGAKAGAGERLRTERDIPMIFVLVGLLPFLGLGALVLGWGRAAAPDEAKSS